MGLGRTVFKKLNDLTYLKLSLFFQLGSLLLLTIVSIWHIVVLYEVFVLLSIIFDMIYLLGTVYMIFEVYKVSETQNYENHQFTECQAYWNIFQFVYLLFVIGNTYFRAFGALSNASFTPIFVFYIVTLIVFVLNFILMLDSIQVTTSECSDNSGINYLEEYDEKLRKQHARVEDDENDSRLSKGLNSRKRNSDRKDYIFSNEMVVMGEELQPEAPKIRLSKDKKVISQNGSKVSDTDYNTKSKKEQEYSNLLASDPKEPGVLEKSMSDN